MNRPAHAPAHQGDGPSLREVSERSFQGPEGLRDPQGEGQGIPEAILEDDTQGPVDLRVLMGLVGEDPEMLKRFLLGFHKSASASSQALVAACQQGQPQEAGDLAHKLKSPARYLGALALGELCQEMERAGHADKPQVLVAMLGRFQEEMTAVMAVVEHHLGSQP